MPNNSPENVVWVGTMYGAASKKGLVELSFGESTVQLAPEEAVSVGQQLIEAAEVARTEDFIVRFIGKSRPEGLSERERATIINALRKFRDAEEKPETTR